MKKYLLWLATAAWAVLIFYLTSIPNLRLTENTLVNILIANGSHFFFFGVQGALLYASHKHVTSAITLTSLYGVIDELHQISVPGRTADVADWVMDTFGALVFVLIVRKYLK